MRWAVSSALVLTLAGCTMPSSALERLLEARRLAAAILVQFTQAADAANRAVMADTDETSVAFALEARQARRAVQTLTETLSPLLQELGYTEEARLLDEFRARLAEYTALDDRILDLAVDNSNLKAQRLSFGPGQDAVDQMGDALTRLVPSRGADAARLDADVARVMLALREVQVLQAPHIAETDEAAMTRMEVRMSASLTKARNGLAGLEKARPDSAAQLPAARAALDRFDAINAELVGLSRRNSDVRSLALSLGHKRTLTAACEDSLRALQAALQKHEFTATR